MKKALFAISSLGLGHATRTLSVIKYFAKEYKIDIISYANTLNFLKEELKEYNNINFIEIEDYPPLERGNGICYYLYLILDLIKTNLIIKKENNFIKNSSQNYEFIFSDGRYGVYSKEVPSFLLSHQISFAVDNFFKYFKFLSDIGNILYFRNFNTVFIPDFEDIKFSLAGRLSHNYLTKFFNHKYIGILSSYKKMDLEKDIDYLFVISGYLLEKKEHFISKLIEEAKKLEGKKVFVLGDLTKNEITQIKEHNITIYPNVTKELRLELFNRAKKIISRTGYTTIMDLVEIEKKAILFPTKNSSEQKYLARYHKHKGYFVIGDEDNFDLTELNAQTQNIKPFDFPSKTKEAINLIDKTVKSYFKKNFFSIIIPVYNEEKYLTKVFEKLSEIEYKNYEIIAVENGSTDNSYKLLKEYEQKNSKFKVYKSKKGVSIAKNEGLKHISQNSDYVIFLDCDTYFEKGFLNELNNFLNKNNNKPYYIGTTSIKPSDNNSVYDKTWFKIFDIFHKFTKTSYSIQIAKSDIAKKIGFDEELNFSEDLKFIKYLLIYGDFFFVNTDKVYSSTRRFRKNGYFKTVFEWILQAVMPKSKKRNKEYTSYR